MIDYEQKRPARRDGHKVIWIILALALLPLLAACSAQGPTDSQPTPPVQLVAQVTPTTASPTQSAPTPPPAEGTATDSAPTQPTAAAPAATQAVPTQVSAAPNCSSPGTLTPAVTEGPYFKAGSPERASLLQSGMAGTKLVLTGYVLTADCKPVAHALLDFWQADANGTYDNRGYTLRGHQYTDATGRFQLTTVIPGLYPGRTEHIHVKVQAPNGPVLTTQLFFPGVAGNQSDGIFDPKLLMNVQNTNDGVAATYNFVVNAQ